MIRSIVKLPISLIQLSRINQLLTIKPHHSEASAVPFPLLNVSLNHKVNYSFAKISKKQKDKQKSQEQKKKVKQQIGDIKNFDLNPFQQKYVGIVQSYKQALSQYKVGRLDPALFSSIFVKIGHNSLPIQQLAQIAPKSANSVVLNPFDQDNLDIIQKGIQSSDLGFQVTRVDKTILVAQPPNSMKQIKDKMLIKMKKNTESSKQKISKVRNQARDQLKSLKRLFLSKDQKQFKNN